MAEGNIPHEAIVSGKHGTHHVRVISHGMLGAEDPTGKDIYVFEDDGRGGVKLPPVDSIAVDATEDDVPEILDTYARGLNAGVPPTELFKPIRDATAQQMREMLSKWNKKAGIS